MKNIMVKESPLASKFKSNNKVEIAPDYFFNDPKESTINVSEIHKRRRSNVDTTQLVTLNSEMAQSQSHINQSPYKMKTGHMGSDDEESAEEEGEYSLEEDEDYEEPNN